MRKHWCTYIGTPLAEKIKQLSAPHHTHTTTLHTPHTPHTPHTHHTTARASTAAHVAVLLATCNLPVPACVCAEGCEVDIRMWMMPGAVVRVRWRRPVWMHVQLTRGAQSGKQLKLTSIRYTLHATHIHPVQFWCRLPMGGGTPSITRPFVRSTIRTCASPTPGTPRRLAGLVRCAFPFTFHTSLV